MSRKRFIESVGGECRNWTWSWSFVNHKSKQVIFGLWNTYDEGNRGKILGHDWQRSPRGRKQPGYNQALEHLSLVEQGYDLLTFPQMRAPQHSNGDPLAPSSIATFVPTLTPKKLLVVDGNWYAIPLDR